MKWFILFFVSLGGIMSAQNTVMSPLGPEGGIISLLNGSVNDAVVLAVVRENGLFRSIDGGLTWQRTAAASFSSSEVQIHAITFHPRSADTVFLATSLGLYRSNDKGATFSLVTSFPAPTLSMEYSPANLSVVFGSDTNGPLKSIDGGKTWIPLKDNNYFGNRYITNVAVHPSDTGNNIRLIASTGFDDATGLFFSSNSGQTWKPFNKGLSAGKARRIYKVDIDSMGIGTKNFRAVIGTADGIYAAQSDYNDTTWMTFSSLNLPSTGVTTAGMLVYDKYDSTALEKDRHKFALYYTANASEYDGYPLPFSVKNGLFKIGSKNNSLFSIGFEPPVQRIFTGLGDITSVFIPIENSKSKIYLGTTNGIFISTDDGTTWQRKNSGINHVPIRNVVSLPSVAGANLLFAGIYGGGVMRSVDEGVTWSSVNNGLTSPYVTSLSADKTQNILYAGTSYSMYRSVDRGLSWTLAFKVDSAMILNPKDFSNRNNETTVRHSPVNSSNIMLNSPALGLWFSTNSGGVWTKIKLPVTTDSGKVPENIEFDPIDASTIYFSSRGLFKSTNAGQSWVNISSNLPSQAFNSVTESMDYIIGISPTINPRNTNEIFLPTTFQQGEGIPYRTFKTTNGGASWDPMTAVIPAYDILYDPNDPLRVVAGGPGGLFGTKDGGNTWKRITDSLSTVRYFLLDGHHANSNVLYTGSEQGAYKLEFTDYPKLTIDTSLYDFGSFLLGGDSSRSIPLKNLDGSRNVVLSFLSLSDTLSFRYIGPAQINIPAGGQEVIAVLYAPVTSGNSAALLRFASSDISMPFITFTLRGHSFNRYPFEKFSFAFGSVSVNQDSILSVAIPNEGREKLTLTLLQRSDSVNFSLVNGNVLQIDTGKTGTLLIRFHPQRIGDYRGAFWFSTNNPKFPIVQLNVIGTGVAKNYLSRRVVVDTSFGKFIEGSVPVTEYFRQLRSSLTKAGLQVLLLQSHQFGSNHSIMIAQPGLPIASPARDSLQRFVAAGGTLVLLADHRDSSARIFNELLSDGAWMNMYGAATGIRFGQSVLIDSLLTIHGMAGGIISYPVGINRYSLNIDSLISFDGTYLTIDSTVKNTKVLFTTRSSSLYSRGSAESVTAFTGQASTVALSSIGTGRIVAVADPELWWNGVQEDTTDPFGLYGADNLQFALNIFGSIENVVAELRETIEERYDLISIPYTFEDSSVTKLFQDLGEHNTYLWRMFGRYTKQDGYKEFPNQFSNIRRGEGYWLITKEKRKINLGTTSIAGASEDFEITVNPGFTMIGNPFPYSVSWIQSMIADSVEKVIWSYNNGNYDSSTIVMNPFKGYWVYNRGKLPKVIRINAAPVVQTSMPKQGSDVEILSENEWKVRLSLSSPDGNDAKNFIGVLKNAEDGWDDHDFVKPPASPETKISLALRNHDVELSADFRGYNRDGHSWNFVVSNSDPSQPMRISAEQFGVIPQEFSLYLIDLKSERMYDLRVTESYEFLFQKKEFSRTFRVVAGSSEYLEKQSNGIPVVPLEYSISQNFPNPFNPVTTIHYSLANSGMVNIEIFNILGQKVRTLVNRQQRIGTYSVTWDGKDNNGILLSTGIYYYQIQANTYRSVKKMTFIK